MRARICTREPAAEKQRRYDKQRWTDNHPPVFLGQIIGVEVEDGQTSVGELLEVMVLHG